MNRDNNYIDAMAEEIRRHTPSARLPEDGDDPRHLFRLYALLALSKGEAVSPRDVHDAWAVWMLERGEAHESIVPFENLSADVRREDAPFVAAIHSAARQARGG